MTEEQLRKIASKVNLRLNEGEVASFLKWHASEVVPSVEEMKKINTDDVEPMNRPFDETVNFLDLRNDEPTTDLLNKQDVLANSKYSNSEFIILKGGSDD